MQWDEDRKRWARRLFGRPARVLLAAWVLERGEATFFQTEATRELSALGETPSAVAQELGRFVEWGLLTRSEPGPSERRVWYSANKEMPAWDVFRAAITAFDI